MGEMMSWNDKVFDNLEQLYWSPNKIGLRKAHGAANEDGTGYVVPHTLLDGGRSLYARASRYRDWRNDVTKDEELLNQVLEIGFAIAPSAFLEEAFFKPLDIVPAGKISTIGREAVRRHATLSPAQFIQHDGFYVSSNSIVMMEMKLKSNTSIEQYLKYCTLIALEEIIHGRRDNLGLIYLVPQSALARTATKLLLSNPNKLEELWRDPVQATNKSRLRRLLENHGPAVRDVGRRLKIKVTSWHDLIRVIERFRQTAADEGNETLENLMNGLIAQIRVTPDCEIG